ncbi:SDR family NAD(P)-dependent oxidoreductase, partial [Streptomyces sp. JWR5-1]
TLLTQPTPWPATTTPRRAAISSFGMSGTNAHLILEEAPRSAPRPTADEPSAVPDVPDVPDAPAVPWVLSARSEAALRAQATRLLAHLHDHPGTPPLDLAYSLALTRARHEYRAALTGADPREHAAALEALASGAPHAHLLTGSAGRSARPVFVFPGQGAQWTGMAVELLDSAPVFAARMAECAAALEPHVDWSLLDVVRGEPDAPGLDRVDVVQPVLWAVMVSLAELWRHHGVEPAAVLGHSQGEIAAAAVAGVLSLADAARVVALRSQALRALAGRGGMVSVAQSADRVRERITAWDGRISLAAVNGPSSVVVSGDPGALDELLAACEHEEVRARRVEVDYASHSDHVEAIEAELARLLDGITPQPGSVTVYSSLTGRELDGTEMDAAYWYRNLRETVEFEQATRTALTAGATLFIEVSPHPVLSLGLQGTIEDAGAEAAAVGTLRRDHGGLARFLTSLAEAHVHGAEVDWHAVFDGTGARRTDLPTYPFQHTRYWLEDEPGDVPGRAGAPSAAEAAFWRAVEEGDAESLAAQVGGAETGALDAVLPALASWRRNALTRAALDGWRYRVTWTPLAGAGPAASGAAGAGELAGTWLLVAPEEPEADGAALVDACAAELTARGARVVVVPLAAHQRADRAEAGKVLEAALAEAAGSSGAPGPEAVAGAVSLLALADGPGTGAAPGSGPASRAVLPPGTAATLALVQALDDSGVRAPLWCVTSGAVQIGRAGCADPESCPEQAQLWGMGQAIALEAPGRWGGLLDLPEAAGRDDASVLERMGAVLAGAYGAEDQVAVRDAGVFARRVARCAPGAPAAAFAPRGTALVTGGTGSLGGHVARHLAASGAEHVVLTSRRGPDAPGAAELVAELTAAGVGAEAVACDVADRAQVEELVARLAAEERPVRAVFHTAGVDDTAAVWDTDAAAYARVLSGKVGGALHLDAVLGDAVDAFVLFSSISGVWGNARHSAYAAANAALDALAHRRRARGRAATSVAWGWWEGEGLAAGAGVGGALSGLGLAPMAADRALAALWEAVASGEPALVVADVDWHGFAPAFTALRPSPLIGELPEARAALAGDAAGTARDGTPDAADGAGEDAAGALRRELAELPVPEQEHALRELVREHAAAVLDLDGPGAVRPDKAFRVLGFDSLTAVDLRNRLGRATGLRLPAALVFDHPTPAALAAHLRGRLDLREPAADGAPAGSGADADAAVRRALAGVPLDRLRAAGVLDTLLRLADDAAPTRPAADATADATTATPPTPTPTPTPDAATDRTTDSIDGMDAESLIQLALGDNGS